MPDLGISSSPTILRPSSLIPSSPLCNAFSSNSSSSLYLFTFLITILVLGLISASLLLRAFYVRRRFQRRVEDAIQAGQPLPQDAAEALGLVRPNRKKEKNVGPMPAMWEAEMGLDRKPLDSNEKARLVGDEEKGWGNVTPLSVLHFPPPREPTPPPSLTLPLPRTRFFGLCGTQPLPRPSLDHMDATQSIMQVQPVLEVPPAGTEISVGVLIALPFQEHGEGDRWIAKEDAEGNREEMNVPEVILGVMGCKVDDRA